MQFDIDTLCHLANGLQSLANGEPDEHIKDREVNRVHSDLHHAIGLLKRTEENLIRLCERYDYVG